MAEQQRATRIVLAPEDEYNHEPDPVPNYNESMYLNVVDHGSTVGAWFRIGNRVNEGYAEMSCCVYLPDGRVGFMYRRPEIATNEVFDAGGLRIDVEEPFRRLRVRYAISRNPAQYPEPLTRRRRYEELICNTGITTGGYKEALGTAQRMGDENRKIEASKAQVGAKYLKARGGNGDHAKWLPFKLKI